MQLSFNVKNQSLTRLGGKPTPLEANGLRGNKNLSNISI